MPSAIGRVLLESLLPNTMYRSNLLESTSLPAAYYRPVDPVPALVNQRMTQFEVTQQTTLLPAQLQQVRYSIPDYFALPGVILLLLLIFHNGRQLIKTIHLALRSQYVTYHMMHRSRQIETLERIFNRSSASRE